MTILVLSANYPNNNGERTLAYIHTRNVYYSQNGTDVVVLNFATKENYEIDEIPVITLKTYQDSQEKYDVLVCHAPNLRNHYRFLKKYGNNFKHFVFFFHGHEVLRINSVYSKPYSYMRSSKIKAFLQECYDTLKLFVWRHYFPKVIDKSQFVFVSEWMLDEFEKWIGIKREQFGQRWHIIYNAAGAPFIKGTYVKSDDKRYDFVTIRNNIDGSKYCVDYVNDLAKVNPDKNFLLVGTGHYFEHYEKADNLEWKNTALNHNEIVSLLDQCKFALMPTRTDAQGVMACEMLTYGIPVITSDIPVCKYVFSEQKNVFFISLKNLEQLDGICDEYNNIKISKCTKFNNEVTCGEEIILIKSLVSSI